MCYAFAAAANTISCQSQVSERYFAVVVIALFTFAVFAHLPLALLNFENFKNKLRSLLLADIFVAVAAAAGAKLIRVAEFKSTYLFKQQRPGDISPARNVTPDCCPACYHFITNSSADDMLAAVKVKNARYKCACSCRDSTPVV